jgi:hypothetical protein
VAEHKVFNCPACSTFNTSVLKDTVLLVCKNCSAIVFENVNGAPRPDPTRVPADWSFVQMNTTGEYGGETFTVVGRVRLQLRNDYKNFWCGAFRDGRSLWIMESFASFSVFDNQWQEYNNEASNLRAGSPIRITKDKNVIGEYVEKCEGISYEGEVAGWKLFHPGFFFVQGSRTDGETAIFVNKAREVEFLQGRKVEIQKLNLKNIIAWNEWK